MYTIGFSIVRCPQCPFLRHLCGLLEVVPFVGNITAHLTSIMALSQGGGYVHGPGLCLAPMHLIPVYPVLYHHAAGMRQ